MSIREDRRVHGSHRSLAIPRADERVQGFFTSVKVMLWDAPLVVTVRSPEPGAATQWNPDAAAQSPAPALHENVPASEPNVIVVDVEVY